MKNFCVAGFGEVMLRLCPPGKMRFAQALPIMDVDPAHVAWMEEDHDRFPCVQGLEDAFLQSAAAWALPKELGIHL